MSKLEKLTAERAKSLAGGTARERLEMLFDQDSFVELDGFVCVNGAPAGVVCGYGSIMGGPVYAFAQDRDSTGGAVGAMHAAKISKVYDLALKTGAPVVGIYDSNGARLSEGAGALDAYGDLLRRSSNLSGVVPQISLVLGACVGASAMLASCADFVIMSEKAEFFAVPPTGNTASGTGSAANAAKSGVAHIVAGDDAAAVKEARTLISMMPINNLAAAPVCDFADPARAEALLRAACEDIASAKAGEIVAGICDQNSAVELLSSFGTNVYAAMATMGGFPCGVIATKGGSLTGGDCAKIAKLVSVWDSFQIPVLTLVNSSGMEDSGSALCTDVRDMARLAHVYAEATTAKLCVITGEAYGSAYIALASRAVNSDYTVAWPSAVISALAPKTAVAFLYSDKITADKSREAVEAEYMETEAGPFAAAAGGYIDDVIDPALTRPALLAALDLLSAKRVQKNPKKHSNMPL